MRSTRHGSRDRRKVATAAFLVATLYGMFVSGCSRPTNVGMSPDQTARGREIFRYDTFGDEQFWTDTLHLERVIASAVDPTTALGVGLKVDMDALPAALVQGIQQGKVDLKSPATTVALLKLNAVVGVRGDVRSVNGKDTLTRVGVTCALCHSTVDDAFSKGIGHRRDGWPNRDLNVGAIIALAPAVPASARQVYNSWGPGKYDPRFNIDGQNTPLVIPPAYGLARVRNETYTAEGPISYWNAYVAVTQMHGHGNFSDPRLPLAVVQSPDLVTPKLAALREYQHSLETPPPSAGSVDAVAAARGEVVFGARCASCHVGVTLTDNNNGVLHQPAETGMDPRYAQRTTQKRYRTTPLRGLGQHAPYFHDGSAATLRDVVEHYDAARRLGLTTQQKADLVAYLNTL
jgi:mono/diheme cytochrome c family protein